MLNIEELKYIREKLTDIKLEQSDADMNVSIVDKISGILSKVEDNKQCLWSFYWDCGRQGDVEGIFKATEDEVEAAIGKEVYFGEILGKHSEVYGTLEDGEIELESDDPLVVMDAKESGYNPLEYLKYKCPVCEDAYSVDEFNVEENICNYCLEERDKKTE